MEIRFTIPGPCVPKGRGRYSLPGKRWLDQDQQRVAYTALKNFVGVFKNAASSPSRSLTVKTPTEQIDRFSNLMDLLKKDAERSYNNPIVHTPKETRQFEDSVALVAQSAMRRAGASKPLECAVRFELVTYRRIPKSASKKDRAAMVGQEVKAGMTPDYDNVAKSISDAMNKIVFADDRQIVDAMVSKRWDDGKGERFEVVVSTDVRGQYQWVPRGEFDA